MVYFLKIPWRKFSVSCFFLSLIFFSQITCAAEQAPVYRFDIKDTQAERALIQLADQANLLFFMPFDLIDGLRTNPVVGTYTVKHATRIMLAGTSLEGVIDKNGQLSLRIRTPYARPVEAVISSEESHSVEEVETIETIHVSGVENTLTRDLQVKKHSTGVQERVVRSQLLNQPIQNLSDGLTKRVGVSISRSVADRGGISVRGFGPDYNVTTLNGRTVSTSKISRNFDYRIFPSDFVKNVDIVKTASAQLNAGSIGANINILTARPFDYDERYISTRLTLNASELKASPKQSMSLLFSDTYLEGKLGLMLGVLKDDSVYRVDRYTTQRLAQSNILPENLQLPVYDSDNNPVEVSTIRRPLRMIYDVQNGQKERLTLNTVLQWKSAGDSVQTLDFILARYNRNSLSSGIQYPGQAPDYRDVVVDADNSIVQATLFDNNIDAVFEQQVEDIDTRTVGYNAEFRLGKWGTSLDLSHSATDNYETLNALVPHYIGGENKVINLDFSSGGVLSSETTIPLNDTSSLAAHWNGRLDYFVTDNVDEIKLDTQYLFDEGVLSAIELGFNYQHRAKSLNQYKWNDATQCAPCGGQVALPSSLFSVVNYSGFLGNQPGSYPTQWVTLNDIDAYNAVIQQIMLDRGIVSEGTLWHDTVFDPSASYENREEKYAFYGKLNFDGELSWTAWNLEVGGRYLMAKQQAKGYLQYIEQIDLDPNSSTKELRLALTYSEPQAAASATRYHQFLPHINLSLNLREGLYLKMAASRVISFPKLEEIGINQRFTSDDTGTVVLSGGNPYLNPAAANQFDIAAEYYSQGGNAYSATLFYKNLSSVISTRTYERPFQGDVSDDVLARRTEIIELVNRSDNLPGGEVWGLELSARLNFATFCQVCDGLRGEVNLTRIIDNQVNADPIDLEAVVEPKNSIEGLSDQALNLNLKYTAGPVSSYFTYSWRSDYLHARQGIRTGGIPEHTASSGQLDWRLNYRVDDDLDIYFDAFNLLRDTHLEYADVRRRVTHFEYTGISYQLGVRKNW